jgi:hypothetical protein
MADIKAPSSAQNTGFDEKVGKSAHIEEVYEKQKDGVVFIERVDSDSTSSITDPESSKAKHEAVETDLQLVTRVLSVEDDPTENPWTFRMWFLGTRCYSASMHERNPAHLNRTWAGCLYSYNFHNQSFQTATDGHSFCIHRRHSLRFGKVYGEGSSVARHARENFKSWSSKCLSSSCIVFITSTDRLNLPIPSIFILVLRNSVSISIWLMRTSCTPCLLFS